MQIERRSGDTAFRETTCDGRSFNIPLGAPMDLTTPTNVDPMYFVAVHEAGHAVAYILAHRALDRDYSSFHRVFIRRDFSSPYIDDKNRVVDDCSGMCEAPDLYAPGIGLMVFYQEPEARPGLKLEMLAKMEWAILTSLAGPFAEVAARGVHSKANMRLTARFCGGEADFEVAEAVLVDYKKTSGRRRCIQHFEDRTRDLVLKSRPAIIALAKALLVRETLDYDDAYAVVEPFLEVPHDANCLPPAGRFSQRK